MPDPEAQTWNQVEAQSDADHLLDVFGGFHDGCLREAHLWTGHWVSDDLAMACPFHLDVNLRVLIQRQFKDPAAIEMLFEQVTRFNLVPTPENYDSIIFEATLLVEGDEIFWSDQAGWTQSDPDRELDTWISAKQLRWRPVDWLGDDLRYGP